MATPFPALDGSAPRKQQFDSAPEMGIDPTKRYTATMDTSMGTIVIALDADQRAEDGQQLRLPRRRTTTTTASSSTASSTASCARAATPPAPAAAAPATVRRRAGEAALPDRLGGDGQRRAEHQRQPVLPDQRPERRQPAAAVQPLRPGREGPRRPRRDAERRRPIAATGRAPTSSSTRSPSPSPTEPRWPPEKVSLARRRAASPSARRASPIRGRRAASTAVTSAACSTASA